MKSISFLIAILLFISLPALGQVNITLPVLEREAGAPDEYISVMVDNINAEDSVMAFSFFLYYDKTVIYLLDTCKLGTIATNSLGAVFADTAAGVISAAYVRIEPPYFGSGALLQIPVKYHGTGTSKLSFVNPDGKNTFDFRDGVPQAISNEGSITVIKPVSVELNPVFPTKFNLDQNYPNPFNPTTRFSFSIPEAGFTTLKLYNISGEEAAVMVNRELNAGQHEIVYDASGLASGIYYARLQAGNNLAVKKIVLLK